MARYIDAKEFEIREPVSTLTIERLRSIADGQQLKAFSLKFRHPRFKNRFTEPQFYVSFKKNGIKYTEDARSLSALDVVLLETHLTDHS